MARRPDGTLAFRGRADEQVKVRGFRVEPAEVEAALARHESVARAAVVLREDHPGRRQLVGYVVAREGAGPLDLDDVRAHAELVLPEHMVPAALVVLDDLPRSTSGKLDRRALPAPDLRALSTGVAPRTAREATLAGLLAEVLGLPAVGVEDDVFRLGGDSISAIQLVTRARDAGLELSARDVFAERTVARLAAVARDLAARAEAPGAGIGPVAPTPALAAWLEGSARPAERPLPGSAGGCWRRRAGSIGRRWWRSSATSSTATTPCAAGS